ncbi:hypothetical protein BKA62DRAFT_710591 [Auriculariales sp. MPI-PUGE-AT-0066]|nr:hypothetical protein BKA62DRAFT_710591 [Auriculariales sp. MPI-PUGE-AT-0066]
MLSSQLFVLTVLALTPAVFSVPISIDSSSGISFGAGEECLTSCAFTSLAEAKCDFNTTFSDAAKCACSSDVFKSAAHSCVQNKCPTFLSMVDTQYTEICAAPTTDNSGSADIGFNFTVAETCALFCAFEASAASPCPDISNTTDTCTCYDSTFSSTLSSCVQINCPIIATELYAEASKNCPADSPVASLTVQSANGAAGAQDNTSVTPSGSAIYAAAPALMAVLVAAAMSVLV